MVNKVLCVNFDTYRNLQRHRAVFSAIARLSCIVTGLCRPFERSARKQYVHELHELEGGNSEFVF